MVVLFTILIHRTRSQGAATSKSFPKTVEKINKIVEKEFLVKESFIRFRIVNK
jgi:hypothetical protein